MEKLQETIIIRDENIEIVNNKTTTITDFLKEPCGKVQEIGNGTGNIQISNDLKSNSNMVSSNVTSQNSNVDIDKAEDNAVNKLFYTGAHIEQNTDLDNDLLKYCDAKLQLRNIIEKTDSKSNSISATENITNSLNNFSLSTYSVEEQKKFLKNSMHKQKPNFFNTIAKKFDNENVICEDGNSHSYLFAAHNKAVDAIKTSSPNLLHIINENIDTISKNSAERDDLALNNYSMQHNVVVAKDKYLHTVTLRTENSIKNLPNLDIRATQQNTNDILIDQYSVNTNAITNNSAMNKELEVTLNSVHYKSKLLEITSCNESPKFKPTILTTNNLRELNKKNQTNIISTTKAQKRKSAVMNDINYIKFKKTICVPTPPIKKVKYDAKHDYIDANTVSLQCNFESIENNNSTAGALGTKTPVILVPNLDIVNIKSNDAKYLLTDQNSVNTDDKSETSVNDKEMNFVMDLDEFDYDFEIGSFNELIEDKQALSTVTSNKLVNSVQTSSVEEEKNKTITSTNNSQITKEKSAVKASTKIIQIAKKNVEPNNIYDIKLKEGLQTPIPPENKGFQLLTKMGYTAGTGLGTYGEGITEPIGMEVKRNREGVGHQKQETNRDSNQNSIRFLAAQEANDGKENVTANNITTENTNKISKKRRPHSPIKFPSIDSSTPPPPAPSFYFSSNENLPMLSDESTKRLKLSNIFQHYPNASLSKKNIKLINETFANEIALLREKLQQESIINGCSKWNIYPCEISLNNESIADHTYEFIQIEIFNWVTRHQQEGHITPKLYGLTRNNKNISIACGSQYAYFCLENCLEALTRRTIFENLTLTLQPCFNDLSCYGIHFKGLLRNADMLLPQLQVHEPKLFTDLWLLITHIVNPQKSETHFMVLVDEQSALVIEYLLNKVIYVLTHKVTFSFKGKFPKNNKLKK